MVRIPFGSTWAVASAALIKIRPISKYAITWIIIGSVSLSAHQREFPEASPDRPPNDWDVERGY